MHRGEGASSGSAAKQAGAPLPGHRTAALSYQAQPAAPASGPAPSGRRRGRRRSGPWEPEHDGWGDGLLEARGGWRRSGKLVHQARAIWKGEECVLDFLDGLRITLDATRPPSLRAQPERSSPVAAWHPCTTAPQAHHQWRPRLCMVCERCNSIDAHTPS